MQTHYTSKMACLRGVIIIESQPFHIYLAPMIVSSLSLRSDATSQQSKNPATLSGVRALEHPPPLPYAYSANSPRQSDFAICAIYLLLDVHNDAYLIYTSEIAGATDTIVKDNGRFLVLIMRVRSTQVPAEDRLFLSGMLDQGYMLRNSIVHWNF